jgi:ribose-phosphate pyrophosphokinase
MFDFGNKVRLIGLSEDAKDLVEKVAKILKVQPINSDVTKFSNGETHVNILESVRSSHIYLFQMYDKNINDRLMETLIAVDALKRASAKSISLVIPYYAYSRQDRKSKSREPITAKLVADMYEKAGVDRVITMDLHAAQIQGFFNIPIDNYQGLPLFSAHFAKEIKNEDVVIVSPDHGGVNRARSLAEKFQAPIAIIDKRRPRANVSEIMNIVGS